MPRDTEALKSALRKKKPEPKVPERGLSTGSTLLNLAFSGKVGEGYRRGLLYSFVGDSSSGKTILALSAFAEASIDPNFRDYRLVYADQEGGALMDMGTYFGESAESRIEPFQAVSLEDFYDNMDAILERGPIVGALDSMDALKTEAQLALETRNARLRKKGKESEASYGTDKAKLNSSRLPKLYNKIKDTNSIFVIISQTRANIGWTSQFNPRTYSGGDAIKFYARIQLWTSIRENLKSSKYDVQTGIISQIKVTKNHITGWQGKLELPILRGHGIDDIGGCVHWLASVGHWKGTGEKTAVKKKSGGNITAPEFDFEGSTEKLIGLIENEGMENDLRLIVAEVWRDIEEESKTPRKPRYA